MRKIGVVILSLALVGGSAFARPFKVMTYNVWLGFNKKQNLELGSEWIASRETDVLALQELKGFDQDRLSAAAKNWGHEHAVIFDRQGGFPQGLTSKTPIEKIEQIQPENNPKLRGTLHCKTAGIHFFVVHFDPRNFLNRRKEAAAVAERVKPLIEAGEKVVVLGDFNAHSIADKDELETRTALLEKWRAKEGGRNRSFDADGNLDYSVMRILFEAGLVDASSEPKDTFPTRLLFQDVPPAEFEQTRQRIDFILVDGAFGDVRVQYPRDPILDRVSDHYPLLMTIERD